MNFDSKPYVFSPPSQYMANVRSPHAANLSTPIQLIPVKCSQGMMQTSPPNQHMFYSSPPPPPPHWACNFQPSPVPTMTAIPVIDGQPMIPGLRNNNPQRFHAPLFQGTGKVQFHPGPRCKLQSLESSFKLKALRNGIKIEDPKEAKADKEKKGSQVISEGKSLSCEALSVKQEKDSPCRRHEIGGSTKGTNDREKDETIDALHSSRLFIDLPTRNGGESNAPEDASVNHTCFGRRLFECPSNTKTFSEMCEESACDSSKVNELETLGTEFGDDGTRLNSGEFCGEVENRKQDHLDTTDLSDMSMSPSCEVTLEEVQKSLTDDLSKAEECVSKLLPRELTIDSNTNAKLDGNDVEESNSKDSSNNDLLIEDFVHNVIFCAVNSLLQKRKQTISDTEKIPLQDDCEFKLDGDGQEDNGLVSSSRSLVMDSRINKDGVMESNEEIKRAFSTEPATEEEVKTGDVSNDCKPFVESLPNPSELIPNSSEAVLNGAGTVPDQTEEELNQTEGISPTNDYNLEEPICLPNAPSAEEHKKNLEDQEVEDLFTKLALKKGIKVGRISPTNNSHVEPEQSSKENANFSAKDSEIASLFVRIALEKGIKVGRVSPRNMSCDVDLDSVPDSSKKESANSSDNQEIEDLFVRLALEKGIKVGNISPVNDEQSSQENLNDMKIDEDFKRLALRNGIRVGKSPLSAKINSNGNTVKLPEDDHDPFTTPMIPDQISQGDICPNILPPFVASHRNHFNTLVKFDNPGLEILSLTNDNGIGYRKNSSVKQDNFEELAKRHGIKVGETFKRKVEVQTQTVENSCTSQETQTAGLVTVRNVAVQVDVTKEAFKVEYDEWMQEELSLIDPKASSFRELFLMEEEARAEAERRLAVEMDENVKAQRNTKIVIDELKERLANKEEIIEKMNKELKSLKKQKDNEIKRLTKDVKQKDEDLKTATHENNVKDVVIENMREMARDQSERMEEMDEKLKAMEMQMENERIKVDSFFKIQQAKAECLQVKASPDEWQVVKGRHSASKQTAIKAKSFHQHNQIDSLSGFDDDDYDKFICRLRTQRNSGKDAPTSLSAQSSVTSDCGIAVTNNQSSISVDYVSRLPREPIPGSVCSSSASLPPPGVNVPRLPRAPNTQSFGTSSLTSLVSPQIDSSSSTSTAKESFRYPVYENDATLLNSVDTNPNDLYAVPNKQGTALPPPGVMQQELPRASYPSSANTYSTPLLSHELPRGPSLTSDVTRQEAVRGLYPSPTSASDVPLPPPGITVDPSLRTSRTVLTTKIKSPNKFSSFDKLMEALRDSFPDHSRPSLMVYLKKAKESFGNNGFKGKHISEIVDKVAEVITYAE